MAVLIEKAIKPVDPAIKVCVDRHTLYKRRWRAKAVDGTELAVALDVPVSDGAYLGSSEGQVFRVEQTREELLVVPLPDTTEMAAKIGWYLGNQHLPVEIREEEILLEKLHTLAASLDRIGIPYDFREDIFRCKIHSSHQH
ncbi:MAG: hypothetical protein AAF514_03965 [Verrucomicrobiota bacterium]